MKTNRFQCLVLGSAVFVAALATAWGQPAAKSLEQTVEVAEDGSATVIVACAFDAGPWALWKTNFGDDPARARASIKYHLGARVAFDGFKLERDDLNRTAKMTVHTSVAADLRRDGRYSIPLDKEFKLVNNVGRVWFFSGNVANTLSTIKVVLPESAKDASLSAIGSSEQALVYELPTRPGPARRFLIAGLGLLAASLALFGGSWVVGRNAASAEPVGRAT